MDREIQQRLKWIKIYNEWDDADLVCRPVVISRPTLRKWAKRYKQCGIADLKSQSRRPHPSLGTEALMS